jgi:hypothetical protein
VKQLLWIAILALFVAGCGDNDKPPTQAKGRVDTIKTTDGPGAGTP